MEKMLSSNIREKSYLRSVGIIMDLIASGHLRYGDRLYKEQDLAEMLGVKSQSKGIKLTVEDSTCTLECNVVVGYEYDVIEVAKNVQASVKNAVESMTGFQVLRVDVTVSAIAMTKKK